MMAFFCLHACDGFEADPCFIFYFFPRLLLSYMKKVLLTAPRLSRMKSLTSTQLKHRIAEWFDEKEEFYTR